MQGSADVFLSWLVAGEIDRVYAAPLGLARGRSANKTSGNAHYQSHKKSSSGKGPQLLEVAERGGQARNMHSSV